MSQETYPPASKRRCSVGSGAISRRCRLPPSWLRSSLQTGKKARGAESISEKEQLLYHPNWVDSRASRPREHQLNLVLLSSGLRWRVVPSNPR